MLVGTWNLENLMLPRSGDGAPRTEAEYEAKVEALASVITALDPALLGVQEVRQEETLAGLRQGFQADGADLHVEAELGDEHQQRAAGGGGGIAMEEHVGDLFRGRERLAPRRVAGFGPAGEVCGARPQVGLERGDLLGGP